MKLVVKLFHEISTKSRPVRLLFIKQLKRNITAVIKPIVTDVQINSRWDKIEIAFGESFEADDSDKMQQLDKIEQLKEALQRIPGIEFVLLVVEYQFDQLEDVIQHSIDLYQARLQDKSFCVRVKRKGKHSFSSLEAEQQIGGTLLQQVSNGRVDLKSPDELIQIEIIDQTLWLVNEKWQGLGGYPLGQQESVLSLVSGGYDSLVASYLMTRRGIITNFIFFNLGGVAHEIGVKQVAHYLWQRFSITHKVKFISVPFEEVVQHILHTIPPALMGVVLKRMMLRAAEAIAKEQNIPALVTGESIGQVSSQTLINLSVINECVDLPVLRPLIVEDKQSIIAKSREIGVEEYAASMPEYCAVISQKPNTRVKLEKIEEAESSFDFSVLETATQARHIAFIDKVLEGVVTDTSVEVVTTPGIDDVVIDIRDTQEQARHPFSLTATQVLSIPFYRLLTQFPELNQKQTYLLYCQKGTMSHLQTHQLNLQGFKNVKCLQLTQL